MLPYRKCRTWEFSEKTVGLDFRDEPGCCVSAAGFCRVSARDAAATRSAGCQYGPLRRAFPPVSSSRELLAAAGVGPAKTAALVAEATFRSSTERAGTLLESAGAAREPAAVTFNVTSGEVAAVHRAAGVIRASAAHVSVAVSAAYGQRGSPSGRCYPLLRKHRSFDSWFTPGSVHPPFPSVLTEISHQRPAVSVADDTRAAVATAQPTKGEDRLQTLPVETVTTSGTAASEGAPAARPGTTTERAAAETAAAWGATCIQSGGASAPAGVAGATCLSRGGQTTERNAEATVLNTEDNAVPRKPECSKRSCAQKSSSCYSPPDVFPARIGGDILNTRVCQKEQSGHGPAEDNAYYVCLKGPSFSEPVAADVGNREDKGETVPLLQRHGSQLFSGLEREAAFAVQAAQASPRCSPAPTLPPAQTAAPVSFEAAATAAPQPAPAAALRESADTLLAGTTTSATAAAAGPDTEESQCGTLFGTSATAECGKCSSMKCVPEAAREAPAVEECNDAKDACDGPSSLNSSSHRLDSSASIASSASDVLSDEERNKQSLFRSIGMNVPVGGCNKKYQGSAERRSGSASAPAAYDSFASTCPHSLSFVSSHSFSLAYSSSSVTLPFLEGGPIEGCWRRSSEHSSSGVGSHSGKRGTSDMREVVLNSRPRRATYPTLRRSGAQHEERGQLPGQHELSFRTRSARRLRTFCTAPRQDAESVSQYMVQLQHGQRDETLQEPLREHKEANQQYNEDCASTRKQQMQDLAPEERRRLTKPRLSEHQQLLSESWYKGFFNSGSRIFQGSRVLSPPTKKDSTGVDGSAGGKYNLADFTKGRAVAPCLPEERKELRQTSSMVDNGAGLRTGAVHPIVASVSATHRLAAAVMGATLAETEAAVEPAAAKKTALGTANVAAPLDVSEATEGCETRGERETHGAAGVGNMGATPLDSVGPSQIESRAETAAEILQPADSVSPSGSPSDQICFSAAREVHRNERPNSECHSGPSSWERRNGCSLACSTATARDRSRLPLAPADRTEEALLEQSVSSSQQFAAATSETADLPVQSTTSAGEEVVTEVGGAALAAVQGSGADVDAASVHFTSRHTSGCSRRSSPSLPARFASVPACGNDIPVIQLFTAEGEDQGRPPGDSVEENRTRQPALSGSPPAGVAKDERVKVSVSPPKRRHRLPSISLCEAGAIGDEDVCTRTPEERESRSGVWTTQRMAPLSGLSPRTTSEVLGPGDGRGDGFDDGRYSKKEAVAGSTSMVYGRYLGVTDISAGQSTASPSTVSTVSPYSYSGFSSSCSLPSSTCVRGSQVCGSAGTAVVSPSPAGTRVNEFLLTASSSSGGSEDSFMPAAVDDSLPVSSYRFPVQSYENCASSPAPAVHDDGGQEAAEFARFGAGTPNAAGSARACTPRPTGSGFHGATSTAAGADHAAIAAAAGRSPAVSARALVSRGAREETAESSQGGLECAAPPLAGRTSNNACEGEQKEESARQRSLWKSSVRKMFSSKTLLRWKSAFSGVASKTVGAAHPAVNRELVAATEKQEQLPHDADAAAAHRCFCPSGVLPLPPEPASVLATTSGRLRAAAIASASRKYTRETSPLKRNVPMTLHVEAPTQTHRESEYKADKSAKRGGMPSPVHSEGQRDLEQQQQVDSYQERRQEPHKAEQQQERQPRRVSFSFQEDQPQVCQQYKLHSQTQQVGQQEDRDKEQGKERMCTEGTAEEATVAGIYSRPADGGRRGGEGVAEGEEVCEKATDGTRGACCSGSSSWVPLSHPRERKQLHSGQLQHSRELRKEAQWQQEKQQAGGRIEVTGDLQTKRWSQVGGISSQLLQVQYQRHVSEREERPLRRGAQGEYETQAEQHPHQPIGVKQQQEGSRDVPATYALDGGYEGELLRQEACQRELRGSARNCRVERPEQQLTSEQQRRGTQDLKQESFEVTQQWGRLRDNEHRWLTERREQPHEGGNTHPVDGPRGDEASGRNDLSARTKAYAVPVASTSATSPSLFRSNPGVPYAPSSREAATVLPSAAQTLECRHWQRLEHQVAAAPTGSSKAQCCMGESARMVVPANLEEAKRHGDTAAVRSVYTADGTVLPVRLAIPHAEDTMRARTAAAAAPGADVSGQLRALETASQPLGHENFSAIRRGADTGSESCAAGEQTEDNRGGYLDATQEVSVPSSGSISPRASLYRMRSALQTSGGTESGSSRGIDKANQDPQQKLGFSECSHSGHPGDARMHDTPKHQQHLRRCLSDAETLNSLSWTTLRDADFDVRRYDAADTTDGSCARCSALGVNAEQNVRRRHAETTGAAASRMSTAAAAGDAETSTATAGAAARSASTSPTAFEPTKSLPSTGAPAAGKDLHQALNEDSVTEPQAAGTTECDAQREVNTLKREKELTVLAFIQDHLNSSVTRRREYRGDRCCCALVECERSHWSRHERRAQTSCVCAAVPLPHPPSSAADSGAVVDAACPNTDGAGRENIPVDVRALITESAAAYRVEAPEAPPDFFPERRTVKGHVSAASRSWPDVALTAFSTPPNSRATGETQQTVESPRDSIRSVNQRAPQTSGERETRLQHHIKRFLQRWANGEQIYRSSSVDFMGLETSSNGSWRAEQQHQRNRRHTETGDAAGGKPDAAARTTPRRKGRGTACNLPQACRCLWEQQTAGGGTRSSNKCPHSEFAVAHRRRSLCSGDNGDRRSFRSVCASCEVAAVQREQQHIIRRHRSENSPVPLTFPLKLRVCTRETAAAEAASGRKYCRAVSAPVTEVVTTFSHAGAILRPGAAFPNYASAAALACDFTCSHAGTAFSGSAERVVCRDHDRSGGHTGCRGWTVDVAASSQCTLHRTVSSSGAAEGDLLGQAPRTLMRRCTTALLPSAPVAYSTVDWPSAGASDGLGQTGVGTTAREEERVEASAGPAGRVKRAVACEHGLTKTSTQQDRRGSHGFQRLKHKQLLEEDELERREQLLRADAQQRRERTGQRRADIRPCQVWHRQPEQRLAWQQQEEATAAERTIYNAEQVAVRDSPDQPQGETSVRAGDTHESSPASTFGSAGLQPFLMFPRKAEECYRQKLASAFSFRLVVVGIVLLLVQVVHIVGGAVRTGYLWGSHHEEHAWFRVSAAGDAAQLALYVILGLRGHIHGSKSSLEMWTCALFSLAFAVRCCTLLATLCMGQGPSAADSISTAEDGTRLASYSTAVSYQLVRLSLCCVFHVLLSGMMLPARTLICLPMHLFHFGGCILGAGAAAAYARLDLNADGPVCVLSSCLYIVLGCFCQAQLEASQRQLYVQWMSSQKGLQDMKRKRGLRTPGGLTGVEQVALLVRQSQVLLRDAVGGGGAQGREGVFEQLASLQKEILDIVTDVRSIYNPQTGKEEIYELLNFVPEGQVVEPPAVPRVREQADTHPCRQPSCNERYAWMWLQNERPVVKRASESCSRGRGQSPCAPTGDAPATAAAAAARGDGELDRAEQEEKGGVAQEAAPTGKSKHLISCLRAGTALPDILRDHHLEALGRRRGDRTSSRRPSRSAGSGCSHEVQCESDPEDGNVVRETVERLQKAAAAKGGGDMPRQLDEAAVELFCRLGVEWDVDFFQVDKYTEGNSLRLMGEVQLSPLVRPDGLRCERRVLRRFLHSVQRQYRMTNPYHNQLHAAMVSHCCLVLVGECLPSRDALTYTDEICLCVAALAHDIGHPGLTNQYLISSQSLLATTYNDIAVLENYHAACCFRTARYSEELNIFAGLSQEIYSYMRQNIIGLILATDMSKHISYISRLRVRLEAGNFNPAVGADRWLFFQTCMKAADLAHLATKWDQHKRWAELLCEEFYRQGDEERRQGLPVIETFDRLLSHRFPQSQFRFIQVVVSPLIEALVDVEALLKGRGGVRTTICRHLSNNRRKWKMLAVAAGYVHSTEEDEEAADEDEEDTDEQQTTTERPPAREENGVCNARERAGGEEIDSRGIAD